MMENKHILFTAFTYPPFNSIGSRRWAKFSKNLARRGYTVHVIASENPYPKEGNWLSDIRHENIHCTYIPYKYPSVLKDGVSGFAQRIRRKITEQLMRFRFGGNVFDESLFWDKRFEKTASAIIRKYNITKVICSGPPFRVNYYTCKLKETFSHLHIISDFRDVWSDGKVYGKSKFSQSVIDFERKMEDYVLEKSTWLTYTDERIVEMAIKANPQIPASKFVHLPHSYDPDDYRDIAMKDKMYKDRITFVFGGTLTSPCIQEVAIPLWKAFLRLKEERPELYKRFHFIFYQTNVFFTKSVEDYNVDDIIEIRKPISENDFFNEIAGADFAVSILSDFLKDYITTKNISYLPLGKPLVIIANEGRATEMVRNNKVGYALTPENCYEELIRIVTEHDAGISAFNKEFDFTQYSFERVTDIVERLLHTAN